MCGVHGTKKIRGELDQRGDSPYGREVEAWGPCAECAPHIQCKTAFIHRYSVHGASRASKPFVSALRIGRRGWRTFMARMRLNEWLTLRPRRWAAPEFERQARSRCRSGITTGRGSHGGNETQRHPRMRAGQMNALQAFIDRQNPAQRVRSLARSSGSRPICVHNRARARRPRGGAGGREGGGGGEGECSRWATWKD